MRQVLFLVSLVLLTHGKLQSQDFKFGAVSNEELNEAFHPKEKEAPAAVLFKSETQYFDYRNGLGFVSIRSYQYRIKIYNTDGYDYAEKEIILRKYSSEKDKVTNFRARSYHLENDQIVFSEIDKNDILVDDYSKYIELNKFIIPNVTKGAVIEYEYDLVSSIFYITPLFRVQQLIPVNKAIVNFSHPEFYIYKYNVFGGYQPSIDPSNSSATITSRTSKANRGDFLGYGAGGTSTSTSKLNFTINRYHFEFEDILSYKDEGHELGRDNYASAVNFELTEVFYKQNGYHKVYCKDWSSVVEHYQQAQYFNEEKSKSRYFKEDLKALYLEEKTDLEKLRAIDSFLRNRLSWNGSFGILPQQGVKEAYTKQSGNATDLNMIAFSMLKESGLDVYPVLMSSNENRVLTKPTVNGFDYFITSVKIDTSYYFIDITEKKGVYDYIPERIYGAQGLRYYTNGSYSLVDVVNTQKNETFYIINAAYTSEKISGQLSGQMKGEESVKWSKALNDFPIEEIERAFELDHEIEIENLQSTTEELKTTISFDFESDNLASNLGGKTLINPLLFTNSIVEFIIKKDRTKPVFLGSPNRVRFMINLKIPDGYIIQSLPENVLCKLPSNQGYYKYQISKTNSGYSLHITYELNESIIFNSDFETVRKFDQLILDKEQDYISIGKQEAKPIPN